MTCGDGFEGQETVRLLRQHFHARRCAQETCETKWPEGHLPPLVIAHEGWLVVMGQRKWKVQGGFPHLSHAPCARRLFHAVHLRNTRDEMLDAVVVESKQVGTNGVEVAAG